MGEWADRLEQRSQAFAIEIIQTARRLSNDRSLDSAVRQITRAAGSVAANHRAMRRARSGKEFAAKLQIVDEEADECVFWLEVLVATSSPDAAGLASLLAEARELRAIFARAKATTRRKMHGDSR